MSGHFWKMIWIFKIFTLWPFQAKMLAKGIFHSFFVFPCTGTLKPSQEPKTVLVYLFDPITAIWLYVQVAQDTAWQHSLSGCHWSLSPGNKCRIWSPVHFSSCIHATNYSWSVWTKKSRRNWCKQKSKDFKCWYCECIARINSGLKFHILIQIFFQWCILFHCSNTIYILEITILIFLI